MEAVRTNIEGTDNMLHAAIDAGRKKALSACPPIRPLTRSTLWGSPKR